MRQNLQSKFSPQLGKGTFGMLKKTVVGLLLAFTLLFTGVNLQTGTTFQAYACRNLAECREQAQAARNNIANITGNAEAISAELAELQELLLESEAAVEALLSDLARTEAQIDVMESEMQELYEESGATRLIIEETDESIEELMQLISRRMRATQRFNNRNSMLAQLSNAENLNDFVQVIRQAQRAATADSELMEDLSLLLESNREHYETLQANTERLANLTEQFRELHAGLELERAELEIAREELLENQQRLQDRLDTLYSNRQTEQSRLAIIQQTQRILEQTSPPPVVTQVPNATGLANPLPGARVSSEFGPRWGRHHAGVDLEIFTQPRSSILASASGVVTLAEWHNSMGWWVIISHNINGNRVDTVYAHLRYRPPVSPGDIVSQGQVIGTKGATGNVTGVHLHFEVHPGGFNWNRGVNPRNWVNF